MRMKKKFMLLLVVATTLALFQLACSTSKPGEQKGTSTVSEKKKAVVLEESTPQAKPGNVPPAKATLTVSLPRVTFGYLPLYISIAKGYYQQEGLELKIIETKSDVAAAGMVSGDIDLAGIGTAGIQAAVQGAPLKTVLFLYGKTAFYFVSRPEINSVKELKGKNIGVSRLKSVGENAARLALAAAGLDADKDVQFIPVGSGSQAFAALEANSISASMMNVDEAAKLNTMGYPTLMNTVDLMPYPFSGFNLNEKLLNEKPDVIKRWIKATVKGIILLRDKPEEVYSIAVKDFAMDDATAKIAVDEVAKTVENKMPGGGDREKIRELIAIDVLAPLNINREVTDQEIDQLIDFTLLKEVLKELGQ